MSLKHGTTRGTIIKTDCNAVPRISTKACHEILYYGERRMCHKSSEVMINTSLLLLGCAIVTLQKKLKGNNLWEKKKKKH